jgi:glutamine synthetase
VDPLESLKDFLYIPYDELEEKNLLAKEKEVDRSKRDDEKLESEYRKYLTEEKRIKAVTICFSDVEGRFHMLDYDKKYFLNNADNLVFDGSSVRGFSVVTESDLKLKIDWASFYWLPADIFGPGKIIIFADIYDRVGKPHTMDFRAKLKKMCDDLYAKEKFVAHAANETEGFLMEGKDAEINFNEDKGFKFVSSGGYYHSLPKDTLKVFIDTVAETQRAMGFANEKDHAEVAPSQFELTYQYTDVVRASDQVQLYKLVSRQVAENMGMTASFLPKPFIGINGSGMHTNLSICKGGKNIFYNSKDENNFSKYGYDFIDKILASASEISLILNSSVNAHRRLDPAFEAPNQIKCSAVDRTSMIRLPFGNKNSTRIEVRSVSPDANPYLLYYSLLQVGLYGPNQEIDKSKRMRTKTLPGNIYDSTRIFKESEVVSKLFGEEFKEKFRALKKAQSDMCPRELGKKIKRAEVIYHHEITNQYLWNEF